MKYWVVIAALLAAGPAFAIPPMGPRPADVAISQAYVAAIERNNLPAYGSLFAADAKITDESGGSLDREQWLEAVAAEFSGYRQTRFLSVFSGYAPIPGKALRRFMFVTEFKDCRPNVMECFPRWRTQIITVADDKIIELQTSSDFSHRLTAEGAWTFYD